MKEVPQLILNEVDSAVSILQAFFFSKLLTAAGNLQTYEETLSLSTSETSQ